METDKRAASHGDGGWGAGHQVMVSTTVVGILVADGANNREFVCDLGKQRNGFAEVHAGDSGGNGFEFATDIGRCLWFWIKGFVMRGAAVQPDQNAVGGFSGASTEGGGICTITKQFRKAQTSESAEAELQEISASKSVAVEGAVHVVSG